MLRARSSRPSPAKSFLSAAVARFAEAMSSGGLAFGRTVRCGITITDIRRVPLDAANSRSRTPRIVFGSCSLLLVLSGGRRVGIDPCRGQHVLATILHLGGKQQRRIFVQLALFQQRTQQYFDRRERAEIRVLVGEKEMR